MSERYGLNGGKASDWLRLYAPNWGHVRFCGWSSISELQWMRPVQALRFLIPSKLEGSKAQLTKKQAVLSMHDIYARLRGSKIFSTFDLRSGYHFMALSLEAGAKSAFVTAMDKF